MNLRTLTGRAARSSSSRRVSSSMRSSSESSSLDAGDVDDPSSKPTPAGMLPEILSFFLFPFNGTDTESGLLPLMPPAAKATVFLPQSLSGTAACAPKSGFRKPLPEPSSFNPDRMSSVRSVPSAVPSVPS